MIDERHEELASLYAFDLLEGAERTAFEQQVSANPELAALVAELRETAASLAHTTPAVPAPADLKARIFATLDRAESAAPAAPDNVIRPSFGIWQVFPWAAAACFALCALWLGQGYLTERTEARLLRNQQALADVSLKTALQQIEIEREVSTKRLDEAGQKLAAANTDLGALRAQLGEASTQLATRDGQVQTLNERIAVLASSSVVLERQLADARQQATQLAADLKVQGDLARYQVTALVSMLEGSPKAVAASVWDPAKQEGVLKVDKLPALAANQDYQLWIVDPQYPNPVDGGVFTVDPQTGAQKVSYKAKQPVSSVAAFAVTLERKGGVPKAEGPFVLLGK